MITPRLLMLLFVGGTALAQYRDYRGGRFESEFSAPPAVAEDERMKTPPPAGAYVAFSLKTAEEALSKTGTQGDFRKASPEIFSLGGMTRLLGAVLDTGTGDLILVGMRDPQRQPLTLDDLVVALRSRFARGEWPLVSIDPSPTEPAIQKVRFEGGIQQTQFGADLLAADYLLKLIAFGIEIPAAIEIPNDWDALRERARSTSSEFSIEARSWFYPIVPSVLVRDGVVAIRDLKVGVFSEVSSAVTDGHAVADASKLQDLTGGRFANHVTREFDRLASRYPSISRLQGLQEMTALARSMQEMNVEQSLIFWLHSYRVREVPTPQQLAVVRRVGSDLLAPRDRPRQIFLRGGVQLTALALRLKGGDVTALKRAVLDTRPSRRAQTWSFVVGDWVIPVEGNALTQMDASLLFAEFENFLARDRLEEAGVCLNKLSAVSSDFDQEVRLGRLQLQIVSAGKKLMDSASSWVQRVFSSGRFEVLRVDNRDVSLKELEVSAKELVNSRRRPGDAHLFLAIIEMFRQRLSEAEESLGKAIELEGYTGNAYYLRGLLRLADDRRNEGTDDLVKSLECNLPEPLRREIDETLRHARRNPDGQGWAVYRQPGDGFEFSYPADWYVLPARDPRVANMLQAAGLTRDAAETAAKAMKEVGRAAIVVNPYDSSAMSIEIRNAGQAIPKEYVQRAWQATLADPGAIERKNAALLEGFHLRTKGITDLGRELRIDMTYDFVIRAFDSTIPFAGRRTMVFHTQTPSRTARVEYHSLRSAFEKRQVYVTKLLDTLRLWLPK